MMIIGYISLGMSVLIIMCLIAYKFGYDDGYIQATKTIRVWFKDHKTTP